MTKNLNLVIGLGIGCIINSEIVNQIALAKSNNPQKCNIYAYVIDKDTQGLNVWNGVSMRNRILGQVPTNSTVQVIADFGNWLKITNADAGFKGTGWVSVNKLGISTRGYRKKGVNLYANANQQSQKLKLIPADFPVKLLGCQGDWAHVEYQGIKGWLKREDQCGAALTTCV
jgi:SH3-like domain-containing protein